MIEPKMVNVREQLIDDPVTGLQIQFQVGPNGHTYLRLYGDCLKCGNREFEFDCEGGLGGTGTATDGTDRPTWLVELG